MKLTRHNGRTGKNGVYNPKHNDRQFDIDNSDHIDLERAKRNVYWDCYNGIRSASVTGKEDEIVDSLPVLMTYENVDFTGYLYCFLRWQQRILKNKIRKKIMY